MIIFATHYFSICHSLLGCLQSLCLLKPEIKIFIFYSLADFSFLNRDFLSQCQRSGETHSHAAQLHVGGPGQAGGKGGAGCTGEPIVDLQVQVSGEGGVGLQMSL